MPMKLISNKALRESAEEHPDAHQPLQDYRRKIEKGGYENFSQLRAVFPTVDKVGERYVFNVGGNKYRLIAGVDFARRTVWIKAVLTHTEYDKGAWK
jgi:mRNA interferase HigB